MNTHTQRILAKIKYKEQQLNDLYFRKVDDCHMIQLYEDITRLKNEIKYYKNLMHTLQKIRIERENRKKLQTA